MRNEFRICFFSLNLDSEIYCKSKCCDFVNIFLCDLIECRLRKHIVFAVKCNCLIFKSARVGALSAREKCPNSNCCMFISSIAFTWMVRRSWIFFLKLSVHYAQYKRCANVVRTAYIYEIHNYTILTNIESVCYVSGGLCRKYIFMFIGNKFPNTSCHTVGDGKSLR